MSRSRNVVLTLGLLLSFTALSLAVAELAWRWLNGVDLLSRENRVQHALDMLRSGNRVLMHDPLLGWRMKDDVFIPEGGFTTGPMGVRMNATAPGPLREGGILAVGDSFTAGSGVRDDETWPARLEALLGQPVTNGASGAYGVDQIVLRAEQLLPDVRPATLIVALLSQDSLRNSYVVFGGAHKPYFEIENGAPVLKGVPVPLVAAAPLDVGLLRELLGYSYMVDAGVKALGLQQWWIDNKLRYRKLHTDQVGVEISCHLMRRLAGLKRTEGLRVIVLMLYGAGEVQAAPAPWFAPPVIECARREGLEALDTHALYHALAVQDRRAFIDLWLDEGGQLGHPSIKGSRFIADLVARTFFAR